MELHKLNLENAQRYILGGKADFVIRDINTQDHIEFKVRQDIKNNKIYYVRYKSIDWLYIGVLEIWNDKPVFRVSIKGKMTEDMILKSQVFYKFILYVYHILNLPCNIDILYTGVCSRCGRKLTDPIYIEIGIGKICLEKSLSY